MSESSRYATQTSAAYTDHIQAQDAYNTSKEQFQKGKITALEVREKLVILMSTASAWNEARRQQS
jgi:DNA-binding protein H-NS